MTKATLLAATVLVSLSLWAAFFLDSFGTMILSIPGFLFFFTLTLNTILKTVKLKSLNQLKPLILVIIGVGFLFSALKISDHGLAKLTKERECAIHFIWTANPVLTGH